MSTKLIALDAGHGLYTAGKQTPDGIKEWTLNDNVADKVAEILSEYDCKIIRTDMDEGATDESLEARWKKYVYANVGAFVSLHHNAYLSTWSGATGVEVYTDAAFTAEDRKLATLIYNKMVVYTGLRGRGVKAKDYYVINQNYIPAVLVEGGFMDGTNDHKIITSDAGQSAYARAVAEGLIEFLGLEKKPNIEPEKKTTTDIARVLIDGLKTAGYDCSEVLKKALELLAQSEDTEEKEEPTEPKKEDFAPVANYFTKYSGTTNSIVSALKTLGVNSSFAYRAQIAKANGIRLYAGTATQNTKLLNLLKSGMLIKP